MDVAVIGAGGTCGRQTLMQLLDRRVVPADSRLQLVGHLRGPSATELWGLRADLADAYDDWAPTMEIVLDPSDIRADIVVMMAGTTISSDLNRPTDRTALGVANAAIFRHIAAALGQLDPQPTVVVQSNPVELGVAVFAEAIDAHKVIGAAGRSDSVRFRREIATELGLSRRQVQGFVMGQHGDHMVPIWSHIKARGVASEVTADMITRIRSGRILADLPQEIRTAKAKMVDLVREGEIETAFDFVQSLPPDLRASVKPFFTHFTAGRTTEAVTARSAVDIVDSLIQGNHLVVSAQVALDGEWPDVDGVLAVPVIIGPEGWSGVLPLDLADDEQTALAVAAQAIAEANRAILDAQP